MYNHYLANYKFLKTVLLESYKQFSNKNRDADGIIFKNTSDFYNSVILKYLCDNNLLLNFEFLFVDIKKTPNLKISLFDELIKSEFDFNSEYKKDFEVFACEEYISNQIGRDFLIIHNYLIKNHLMKNKNVYLLLSQCKDRIRQYIQK